MTKITKEKIIPTIIIDTREQRPYLFSGTYTELNASGVFQVKEKYKIDTATLRAGDYSLQGLEQQISIERKELNDFVKTIITDKDRFRDELLVLQTYNFSCILVEADLQDIITHQYTSQAAPNAVIGAMNAIMIYYNVPVILAGTRANAKIICENLLLQYWEKSQKDDHIARMKTYAQFADGFQMHQIEQQIGLPKRGKPSKQPKDKININGELVLPINNQDKKNEN